MDQQTRRIELGARPRELPLDHLKLRDGPAELAPLLRVRRGDLDRCAAQSDRKRTDADAATVQHALDVVERGAVASDPIALRHAALFEDELSGVRGVKTHLLLPPPRPEAARGARNAECGQSAVDAAATHAH